MILRCHNSIYRTMIASLLYFRKFYKTTKNLELKINTYDTSVASHMMNDNQQTIFWHVDDCKISHVDPKVNDKLIKSLKQEYESIFEDGTGELTVNRGKKHTYLGMTLDYSK